MRGTITGRDEELAALFSFLSGRAGLPAVLLLEGEAGIGKTTLWREAVTMAGELDYRVLACGPSASEAQLSFAGLGDLLEDVLAAVLPELPTPQRRALEVALALTDASGPPSDPRALATAFLAAVRVLARDRPVLIAIDDVQWLDSPTAGLLDFAVRRLREGEPIALLVARRIRGDEPLPIGLARSLREARLERLEVGPLTLGALHHMLSDRLGTTFSRPALRKVHEASGGNPFYALELARALARVGGRLDPGQPLPVPAALRELVSDRLAALPDETKEALVLAAALAAPTATLIGAALGRDPWPSLRPAIEAQVIELDEDRIRFSHPLLASTAYSTADLSRRRAVHRALARVVPDLEEHARHLALAAEPPDADTAAILEEAARRARTRGAPGVAAELLDRARSLTAETDSGAWARRTLAEADALGHAGDLDGARSLAGAVVARLPAGPARARALLLLSSWDVARSIELGEQALREARDDVALRARIQRWLSFAWAIRGSFRAALGSAEAALAAAEAAGEVSLLAEATAQLGFVEAITGAGEPEARLGRAVELERAGANVPICFSAVTLLGLRLLWRDDLDVARRHFELQYRRAGAEGDDWARGELLVYLAQLELRAGNWAVAHRNAHEALELRQQEHDAQLGQALYATALVDAHLSLVEPARAAAEQGLAQSDAIGDKLFHVQNRVVLGFLELSLGNHEAAVERLSSLGALLERMGIGEPGVHPYRANEAEGLIGIGALDSAEQRIDEIERRGRELQSARLLATGARCRALLLAARNDLVGALATAERALAEHDRLPDPFERGRTLLVLGQLQRRTKQKRAARESLQRALEIFDRLGARLWADKARAELGRISGRVAAGELTATERRVAELVASGRTNRETAAELFVTVRAVEANLSRIYAKLGVRSRTELTRKLAEEVARPQS